MLPSHLQVQRRKVDDDDDDVASSSSRSFSSRFPDRRRLAHEDTPPLGNPPLGLTGVLCDTHTLRVGTTNGNGGGEGGGQRRRRRTATSAVLKYTVFRPRNMKYKPPLVCVAGGPFLPSTYLSPLVHLVTDRSVVLYDYSGSSSSDGAPSATTKKTSRVAVVVAAAGGGGGSRSSSSSSATESGQQLQQEDSTSKTAVSRTDEASTTTCTTATSSSIELVEDMVDDLEVLLEKLACGEGFHLLGHSFGGVLVYEYLRRARRRQTKLRDSTGSVSGGTKDDGDGASGCQSAILASTPSSIEECEAYCEEKLLKGIRDELEKEESCPFSQIMDGEGLAQSVFRRRHECRVEPLPLPLQQSFQMAGYSSSRSSAGLKSVRDYKASSTEGATETTSDEQHDDSDDNKFPFPPVLILRGQHDFVTQESCENWSTILTSDSISGKGDEAAVQMMTLAGCSHYGMVENESLYGGVLSSFVKQHDPPSKPFIPPVLRR